MPPSSPAEAAALALAEAVGAHAFAAYVAVLASLLLAASLFFASVRRAARRRAARDRPALVRRALRIGLALALAIGCGLVFATVAAELGAGDRLARIDQVFSDAVQQSTPALALQVFGVLTHLGDPLTLGAIGIVGTLLLLARGEPLFAAGLVAAMGGNALLNPALKQVFERIRPLHESGLPLAEGWSFPSGHSSGALVTSGMLAYLVLRLLPQRWHLVAVLLATAAAFSVGASRVFLQVHFASDVIAGFASGTAWLITCILGVECLRVRRR